MTGPAATGPNGAPDDLVHGRILDVTDLPWNRLGPDVLSGAVKKILKPGGGEAVAAFNNFIRAPEQDDLP